MGTYLGNDDQTTDRLVQEAVQASVLSGAINVIDTAINYRFQRAERSVGRALANLIEKGDARRDELFISTKNGYLTHDGELHLGFQEYVQKSLIEPGVIAANDVSSQMHCMKARFLQDQFERSLRNLGLDAVDLIYLHNAAEAQIPDIGHEAFLEQLGDTFRLYEGLRRSEKIRYYGLATWSCFRLPEGSEPYLGIEEVFNLARKIGGEEHGFRFVQIPFNHLANEVYLIRNQSLEGEMISALEVCRRLGIGVFASVPLMQGQVLQQDRDGIPGSGSNALRNLQLVRSTPPILSPLVGHKDPVHVNENLGLAQYPPMSSQEFRRVKWGKTS